MRKAHFVLQGKRGVGKTFVASLIAQYLSERGEPVACLDTDQVNGSFQDISSLGTRPVKILKEDSEEIDIGEMDGMIEHILTEDSHFGIDNGATSFVPMSRYLVQDGVVEAILGAGTQVIVHTIVAGGPELVHTGRGFLRRGPAVPAGCRDRAVAQRASRLGARRRRQRIQGHAALPGGPAPLDLYCPPAPAQSAYLRCKPRSDAVTKHDPSPKPTAAATSLLWRLREIKRPIFEQLAPLDRSTVD